jgi:hypothetical protein
MAGDYSRLTFDPRRDRAMVLEQQGRVHLDADFNELAAIVERRLRVETYDFAGSAVVPASMPDSFRIEVKGGRLYIDRGRMYVDGLLAENHGAGAAGYEPVWDEPIGGLRTRIDRQPYLGSAIAPTGLARGGQLVYLDVWQRERTAVEDPSMVEPALGVDTCTRVETVWQVRGLRLRETEMRCGDDWSKYEPWLELTAPSAGRLTSWADKPPQPADPCAVAPVGGYRGTENRLYRIEVHAGGGAGQATIKWSRDNGAVASRITAPIGNPTTLPIVTVDRLGRDSVLRFKANDWVELLDDTHELDRQPGIIAQVGSIDQSQSTVTLTAPLSGTIDVQRNPRMRRWDQTTGLTGGVIPITTFGQTIALEDGINVKLELAQPGGHLKTGDWWVFAARAATASIEELHAVPPRGLRHHYARLAILRNGKVTEDCRVVFPGDCECESDCGCTVCVTPASHDGDEGPMTIQKALDRVSRNGGRVCLVAGIYPLKRPLRIAGSRGVTLAGEGARTVIAYEGDGLGIEVLDCLEVSLERFTIAVARANKPTPSADQGSRATNHRDVMVGALPTFTAVRLGQQTVAIALVNTIDCRVDRCFVVSGLAPAATSTLSLDGSLGIGLGGIAMRTRLHDNVVFADVAIGDLTIGRAGTTNVVSYDHLGIETGYFLSVDLTIVDNMLLGLTAGVDFGSLPKAPSGKVAAQRRDDALGPAIHLGATRCCNNLVVGSRAAGIAILGAGGAQRGLQLTEKDVTEIQAGGAEGTTVLVLGALAASLLRGLDRVEVAGNVLDIAGIGIAIAPGNARVEGNDVTGTGVATQTTSAGIVLSGFSGLNGTTTIADNTVRNMGIGGIAWNGSPGQVRISNNRLGAIGRTAIGGPLSSEVDVVQVDGNTIDYVLGGDDNTAAGIQVVGARTANVRSNTVLGIGEDDTTVFRAGILLSGCEVARVTDNVLGRLAPGGEQGGIAYGIVCSGRMDTAHVASNIVELEAAATNGYHVAVFIADDGYQLPAAETGAGADEIHDHMIALADVMRTAGAPAMTPLIIHSFEGPPAITLPDFTDDPVPVGRGDIAVVDNTLRGHGPAPLVLIETGANVTLAQNRAGRNSQLAGMPPIEIRADGATIVSSNRVEVRASATPMAMNLRVGAPSGHEQAHCTVLGNISNRPIRLNGAALAAPWVALNIVA